MLLISSSLSKLHKFKRSNYGFISWSKLCVMAAKCNYFGRIIVHIYEANYATRIYLCNPCKPWNRPYRPNPMNCLIRQQPLKTNPLRTRVNLTDRSGQTGAVRYRSGLAGNRSVPVEFKFKFKSRSSTGSYRYTDRFDRFTGRFDRFTGRSVGLTGNSPNLFFFSFLV